MYKFETYNLYANSNIKWLFSDKRAFTSKRILIAWRKEKGIM